MADENLAAVVHHSGGSYPVVAGWGILDDLGRRFVDLDLKGPAYIITDTNVMNPYGRQAQLALQKHGIAAHIFIIPAGETSKSFSLVQLIYDWLVERRAERGHPIIAVGHFPAGRALRPGSHQHGGHGGRIYRRKSCGQSAPGQESSWGLLPAQRGICRRSGPVYPG